MSPMTAAPSSSHPLGTRSGAALDRALLAGLTVALTGLDVLWRALDKRPPDWDQARHLGDGIVYDHLFSLAHPLRFLEYYLYYPPGVPWVTDVFYAVTGSESINFGVAILSNGVFEAILLFATYGIGKEVYGRRTGLLAAFFVATTPMIASGFKEYWLDAPLTAIVALAIYLLLRADGFASRRHAALFGLVCGYGMLVKWSFVLAVAVPVAYGVGSGLVAAYRSRSAARVVNVALAAVLAFAVCGVWYLHNFSALRADASLYDTRASHIEGDPSLNSLASALWYLLNLLDNQLYLVPFLFFCAGVVYALRGRAAVTRNALLLLWVAGVYLCFTALRNKDARYTLPLLPAVAVLAVGWLELVPARLRRSLTAVVVAYGAVVFAATSFGTGLLPRTVAIHVGANSLMSPTVGADPARAPCTPRCLMLFAQHGYVLGPPSSERWYQQQVFQQIGRAPKSERTFSFEGGDSIWFNTWGTRYYAALVDATWLQPYLGEFAIVRGPQPSPLPAGFRAVADYTLPDGELLELYQRL